MLGAALQPFRDTRPLLQGVAYRCRSGLASRKGRKAPPKLPAVCQTCQTHESSSEKNPPSSLP
ncbi:hypothetical protein E5221_25685 [Pseudomonas sp. A2]|nr:hypothetical protein E5221_25685 [Pseudomonas sp. A2]